MTDLSLDTTDDEVVVGAILSVLNGVAEPMSLLFPRQCSQCSVKSE
jgi:hypothetical protein